MYIVNVIDFMTALIMYILKFYYSKGGELCIVHSNTSRYLYKVIILYSVSVSNYIRKSNNYL